MSAHNLIIILGPTASGKTRLAAHLAAALDTEIISADSRQVYKDMNIGTGKDLHEYLVHNKQVPVHLVDLIPAGGSYNLHLYRQDFFKAYNEVTAKGKVPVLCGGTGLYIDALLKGYAHASVPVDEALRATLPDKSKEELTQLFHRLPETPFKKLADTSTAKRLVRAIEICTWEQDHQREKDDPGQQLKPLVFGLDPGRELRRERIKERLESRLQNGLVEEVKTLLAKGVSADQLIFYGLEYKFITMHLQGLLTYEELQQQLTIAIQQFAKRQMTYFRKIEREGTAIKWIDPSLSLPEQLEQILQSLNPTP